MVSLFPATSIRKGANMAELKLYYREGRKGKNPLPRLKAAVEVMQRHPKTGEILVRVHTVFIGHPSLIKAGQEIWIPKNEISDLNGHNAGG